MPYPELLGDIAKVKEVWRTVTPIVWVTDRHSRSGGSVNIPAGTLVRVVFVEHSVGDDPNRVVLQLVDTVGEMVRNLPEVAIGSWEAESFKQ